MTRTLKASFNRIHSYIEHSKSLLLYAAWIISILAFLGSITFSEILKLAPCKLCWIQRIFMFPLVFIIGVGIIFKDPKVVYYVLPMTFIGLAISFYHTLLYQGILPEAQGLCEAGISCTTRYFELFGILSIPALSFLAFLSITGLMIYYHSLRDVKQVQE